ncbi:transcriptional regulator, ArgR family [Ligilactobacillus sp. WC1T17]|uniref:Arginine repressor n=1 Tax=Ligilactobacillus ruminis TaxID=1623 RepID=A0ABY1A9S8_9LACO|nr:transcriptional regulator, ArgR family [Ligilactobacillus ruminis]
MKKELRQAKITELIMQQVISNQEELIQALRKEGIAATQATISRDIRELHIVKNADSNGNLRYTIFQKPIQTGESRFYKAIDDLVLDISQVEFMNVLHTPSRNANALGVIIDNLTLPDVLATLAGYDTLVIISPNKEQAHHFNQIVNERLKARQADE